VIKSSVIEELGSIGDHRALVPLIESLNDSDTMVRWKAIKTLGLFGGDRRRGSRGPADPHADVR